MPSWCRARFVGGLRSRGRPHTRHVLPARRHGRHSAQCLRRARRDDRLLRVHWLSGARPFDRPQRHGRCGKRAAYPSQLLRRLRRTGGENSHEALQIGQFGGDALLTWARWSRTTCSSESASNSETISVKSSGNIIRRNTFLDCQSRPTNRFGNNNRWHANWIENCRGMWIYGADHELAGNRVSGSRDGLCLMAGNTTPKAIRVAQGRRKVARLATALPGCDLDRQRGRQSGRRQGYQAEWRGVHLARCSHPHRRSCRTDRAGTGGGHLVIGRRIGLRLQPPPGSRQQRSVLGSRSDSCRTRNRPLWRQ